MGSFDSTLSLALPNDKVPLRMTGLKRVPISQHADGGLKGKAHCAISVVPTPSTSPSASLGASAKTGQALAQRTRKNGAPSALIVQARSKASANRRSQIFILRTLVWGTRGVKGKAHCAVSVGSHPCAKNAQEWGTLGADCAGEIKSLGQAPKFLGYPVRLESCCASCCGRGRLPSFARLGPFDFAQGRLARRPSPHEPVPHTTLAHRLFDF